MYIQRIYEEDSKEQGEPARNECEVVHRESIINRDGNRIRDDLNARKRAGDSAKRPSENFFPVDRVI